MSAEIVSIVNHKGGTGKTTTTMNLGCALGHLGKKVLLVDMDPQANLSYALGVTEPVRTIADVITGNYALHDAVYPTDTVDLLAGSAEMADVELSLAGEDDRESFLKKLLADTNGYDYILIDSPPSLSLLTLNSLNASSQAIIPMQLEVLSLQGLEQILGTISLVRKKLNPALNVKGIVLVMYDKRRKLSQEVRSFIDENVDSRIFDSVIRMNVKIAEAPSFGQSIIQYDPESKGSKDYLALAYEFLGEAPGKAKSKTKKKTKKNK
jgi:chromosome partitioning protein